MVGARSRRRVNIRQSLLGEGGTESELSDPSASGAGERGRGSERWERRRESERERKQEGKVRERERERTGTQQLCSAWQAPTPSGLFFGSRAPSPLGVGCDESRIPYMHTHTATSTNALFLLLQTTAGKKIKHQPQPSANKVTAIRPPFLFFNLFPLFLLKNQFFLPPCSICFLLSAHQGKMSHQTVTVARRMQKDSCFRGNRELLRQ